MRFPRHLPEGGTIGFVAPSFGCDSEPYRTAFDNAQKNLSALGHPLVLGPNCYAGCGIGISNSPEACGEELTAFYCGGDADALISCGGGELMCETMEHVDFDRIRDAEPKWYMGYSDNTNMTYLLATMCDTASIYGPCASEFGMEPWHESISDAYKLLRGEISEVRGYPLWEREGGRDEEHPLAPYNLTEPRVLRSFVPTEGDTLGGSPSVSPSESFYDSPSGSQCKSLCESQGDLKSKSQVDSLCESTRYRECENGEEIVMEGRLIGGCMDCLVNLLGTRFDRTREFAERYKDDGILWFLESCDLNVMAIRRAIWQMKNAGWLSHARGFLIGRPLSFGQEMMGLDQYSAVLGPLAELGVPVIMDADIGHFSPMMPLICGSYARVTVRGQEISVRMEER